jgi:regulatory protein
MQAIGFLSRREYSRQELRAKLLDSLRKRAREDAALAAAEQAAREEVAQALQAQPFNGIDDAFSPRGAAAWPGHEPGPALVPTATPASASDPASASGRAPFAAPSPANAIAAPRDAAADQDLERSDPEAAVERLLDWLTTHKYLSDARFVESRVNARSRKQGTLRIKLELSRHGLALEPEQAAALRATEFSRAQALWQRKFGATAADARERAKQARFLAARGFAADVVRRVVGGEEPY